MLFKRKPNKNIVEIPLPTTYKLYASPMPYGPYDPFNRLMADLRRLHVARVVALVTDEEIQKKGRRTLFDIYHRYGMDVTHFPIVDFTAPPHRGVFGHLIPTLASGLQFEHIVVHCNAGTGRTGVVIASIVQEVTGMTADESIDFLNKQMITRMTDEQKRFIRCWPDIKASPASFPDISATA